MKLQSVQFPNIRINDFQFTDGFADIPDGILFSDETLEAWAGMGITIVKDEEGGGQASAPKVPNSKSTVDDILAFADWVGQPIDRAVQTTKAAMLEYLHLV